jgi:hypothetical protein
MLTPYAFVACEKVIIGQDSVSSLIALFSKVILNIPVGTEIPKNAIAPKEWSIFSMWNLDPGDEARDCTLCTEILYPDKTPFHPIPKSKMKLEAGKKSQVGIQVSGFPVGQEGPYTVRTWIEENEKTITGPIEFTVDVEIKRLEQPPAAALNE